MRKKRNYTRDHRPDRLYGSVAMGRFINYVMEDGKKKVAEKVVYDAMDLVKKETGLAPLEVFDKAFENVTPLVEVATRRIGGANYQVPREVRQGRKFMLAAGWIIEAAAKKSGKPMANRLAEELILASKNDGAAVKKKQDTHRMAEANRAFAHFAR
ncbi:MAG: 30S ribosomal protein S7 [Patescibacteria group bacterium]|nr:30S ribosomal protein S7 [Patescibacteria group bacterium]